MFRMCIPLTWRVHHFSSAHGFLSPQPAWRKRHISFSLHNAFSDMRHRWWTTQWFNQAWSFCPGAHTTLQASARPCLFTVIFLDLSWETMIFKMHLLFHPLNREFIFLITENYLHKPTWSGSNYVEIPQIFQLWVFHSLIAGGFVWPRLYLGSAQRRNCMSLSCKVSPSFKSLWLIIFLPPVLTA